MKHYFLDLSDGSRRSLYDYQGFKASNLRDAMERAEWLAIDLEHSRCVGEWDGWTVAVRDTSGKQLFSIAIRDTERADEGYLTNDLSGPRNLSDVASSVAKSRPELTN